MSAPTPDNPTNANAHTHDTESSSADTLDQLCINTIRTLSLDAVQQAESGHAGLPLGCAPMAYVIWTRFLRHNPANPKWRGRDRFLLSAGHGSMLLYSLLHLTGYDLALDELKRFRQWDSQTPGHPENILTAGVEISTGPLGQGFANGVGMGIGASHLAAKFNRPGFELVNNFIYAIVSDGDLMEGVAQEAASLAGHLKLGRLIYLYDDNHITIEGDTGIAFTEDVVKRFDAYGWHTQSVSDGNDLAAIEAAIKQAQADERPSLIAVRTTIGFGMPAAGTQKAHSDAPGAEAVKKTKETLGWERPDETFYIPEAALAHFREATTRGAQLEAEWNELSARYETKHSELASLWDRMVVRAELPENWESHLPTFTDAKPMATRAASGECINALAPHLPELIGGSADLAPSNNTNIKDGGDFQPTSHDGRILHFGVREHAMGAALTGMSLNGGLIPFGGTFMVFSDYLKPAIRLAALSEVQVIYVFTHDSIGLGEDGPTHQPIEQIAGLRAIPNLFVIRPADAHETREAWRTAINRRHAPTALALTRQKVHVDRTRYASADEARHGAYIIAEAASADGTPATPELILIATGSEVAVALEAYDTLTKEGIATRVVSMPCWELFEEQPDDYRERVLPKSVTARLGIEAGARLGWDRWTGTNGDVLCMERFGASAPGETVLAKFGFTAEEVARRGRALLKK